MPKISRLLTAAASALMLSPALAETLTMYLDPVPGLLSSRDHGASLQGAGGEAMRKIAAYAGIEFQYVPAPAARALVLVAENPHACMAAMVRTAAREANFKWAGVLARTRMVVYARGDDETAVARPRDMKGRVIGTSRNTVAALWLKEQGLDYYEVADQTTSLRMLQMKRLDLWATNELTARYVIPEVGGAPPRIAYVIRTDEAQIGCNRAVPDDSVARLSQALTRLRLEGGLAEFGVK